MTQAFLGQMDGRGQEQKRNGEKALKAKTEVFWGLVGRGRTKKVVASSHIAKPETS